MFNDSGVGMAAAPFSITSPSTWQAGTINALIFETIKMRITIELIVCGVLLPPPPAAAAATARARRPQTDRTV